MGRPLPASRSTFFLRVVICVAVSVVSLSGDLFCVLREAPSGVWYAGADWPTYESETCSGPEQQSPEQCCSGPEHCSIGRAV